MPARSDLFFKLLDKCQYVLANFPGVRFQGKMPCIVKLYGERKVTYPVLILKTRHFNSTKSAGDTITGNLRIGCLATTLALKVSGIINHYTDAYPGINLTFTADNSPNLIAGMMGQKLDAAFVVAPVIIPELDTHPLPVNEELGKLATVIVSRNNMPKFGAMQAFMQMF